MAKLKPKFRKGDVVRYFDGSIYILVKKMINSSWSVNTVSESDPLFANVYFTVLEESCELITETLNDHSD